MAGLGNTSMEIQCSREELLAVVRHWKAYATDADPQHVHVEQFHALVLLPRPFVHVDHHRHARFPHHNPPPPDPRRQLAAMGGKSSEVEEAALVEEAILKEATAEATARSEVAAAEEAVVEAATKMDDAVERPVPIEAEGGASTDPLGAGAAAVSCGDGGDDAARSLDGPG